MTPIDQFKPADAGEEIAYRQFRFWYDRFLCRQYPKADAGDACGAVVGRRQKPDGSPVTRTDWDRNAAEAHTCPAALRAAREDLLY